MRFLHTLGSLLLIGAAAAQGSGSCDCTPANSDNQVVQFAWYLQFFSDRFYANNPVNQTFISSFPNSSSIAYSENIKGLETQSRLGVRAVQQLGTKVPSFTTPNCDFTFPQITDGKSYLRQAARIESDLTGAFIGLTGYTQKPEISFLLARLAAQHGAHAAWFGDKILPVFFQPNSTALVPAYSPDYVAKAGYKPGMLGQYLHSCARVPANPCGSNQALLIGSLTANLTSPQVSSSAVAASSSAAAAGTPSGTPASGWVISVSTPASASRSAGGGGASSSGAASSSGPASSSASASASV